ncbi:MAG: cysteine synthase A [Clostridia bacterium]|nr:cysteine synthase A [Clostridia bacterium]
MPIFSSAEQLIGHTPLVRLMRLEKEYGLECELVAKLESKNPGGSVKDRVGLSMVEDMEKRGLLRPGGTIIEPTSGNTGIGLALVCAVRGYQLVIIMPDSMSPERRQVMAALGADVILSPGKEGMAGCIALAEKLQKETPGSIIAGQFENPANPAAHYATTGPEIWQDTDGRVDIFVAGVGTGGTLTGTGRYLKQQNPALRVIAVEPASSPLLSQGHAGPHGLQGIGANFVPVILDRAVYDEVLPVTEAEAYAAARLLGKKEGLLCGISAGAALHAAMTAARRTENKGKRIVVLLPDTGDRYLSTALFEN